MLHSSKIERFIEAFIEKRIDRLNPSEPEEYFQIRHGRVQSDYTKLITNNLIRIYDNTSALLTHISAMIASLGIILIVFDDEVFTAVLIFFEMMVYAILAVICIYLMRYRNVMPSRDRDSQDGYRDSYYMEYIRARYMYFIASNGVLINTLFFIATIFVHIIFVLSGHLFK